MRKTATKKTAELTVDATPASAAPATAPEVVPASPAAPSTSAASHEAPSSPAHSVATAQQEGDSPVLVFTILAVLGVLVLYIVYEVLTKGGKTA